MHILSQKWAALAPPASGARQQGRNFTLMHKTTKKPLYRPRRSLYAIAAVSDNIANGDGSQNVKLNANRMVVSIKHAHIGPPAYTQAVVNDKSHHDHVIHPASSPPCIGSHLFTPTDLPSPALISRWPLPSSLHLRS